MRFCSSGSGVLSAFFVAADAELDEELDEELDGELDGDGSAVSDGAAAQPARSTVSAAAASDHRRGESVIAASWR
ncbi:hypothetical protein ACIRON_25440 [Nocardioides sp. NPDC101246]|uniref:hypothetical protein n=1 Tax=Nocardioides sp. NPDC101246 TaxID=3364336 RepID=UPI0037F8D3C4